jgi:unsaturated rhamnogalacturonyl hydrolase
VLADAPELVDAGAGQARALTDLLQDASGLFWHFFLERSGERYGFGWGRGQGWALLGLVDVLEALPREHVERQSLVPALERLVRALRGSQRAEGGWDAVVGQPASGGESSTAAFVAAGVGAAAASGVLGNDQLDLARRAWSHTAALVAKDGVLASVSANVWACTVDSHYRHVPRGAVVPWGQGPLLLAAAALDRAGFR